MTYLGKPSSENKANLQTIYRYFKVFWIFDLFHIIISTIKEILQSPMNILLNHLIQHHVTRQHSHIIDNLTQLNQLTLKSTTKIAQEDLQLIQYLLEKKIINYHPSLMTLKINIHSVLFYQRIYKLRKLCRKFMSSGFADLFERFCQNELMPLAVETSELMKIGVKSRQPGEKEEGGKEHPKKKQTNQCHHFIDYNTLIYEYKQKEQDKKESQVEIVLNIDQITELYRYHLAINRLPKEHREELKQALKLKQHTKPELMFIEVYNTIKQSIAQAELFRKYTIKLRQGKVEEYILQSFKKHQPTEQLRQQQSRNVLLIYNLVKKYPLISEKQLLKMSLLQIVEQRKCLNLLVSDGIIHYYSQSIKSVLYKVLDLQQIQKKVLDAIAHAILNLHIVIGERKVSKEQMLKMEAMLQSLDDSLLLVGL